jgi:hypothetical protein
VFRRRTPTTPPDAPDATSDTSPLVTPVELAAAVRVRHLEVLARDDATPTKFILDRYLDELGVGR